MANPDNKTYLNLVGGMNVKVGPLIAKDDECELAHNYILDTIGTVQKRGGYGRFLFTPPVANKSVIGLYSFVKASDSSTTQLMVVNNSGNSASVLYYGSGGVWTISSLTASTASARAYFFTFVDYVFRTNGADVVNSSTDSANWGTTYCPGVITPKFGKVFQDRAYVAHGGSTNKSRVWLSSLPSSGAITWDVTNDYFDVNPDDGDEITGLENNGNRLLIFKHRALYRWNFGQVEPDRVIGVGTDSQDSVATNFDLGITFFANKNGVYTYTGNRPKLISRKIQPYIAAVSNWSTVYGGVDNDHYYLHVGNLTVAGRTFNNCVLVYHISLDAWTVFSLGNQVTVMSTLINVSSTTSGQELCFGATDGATYVTTFALQVVNGQPPYTSDYTAANISAEFISKEYLLSFPDRTNLNWIDIFSRFRGNGVVFYDLDRQDLFQELQDPLIQRITNIRIPSRECNSVRVRVVDVGTSADQTSSDIEGFNFEHERKGKRDEKPRYATKKPGYGV